MLIAAARAGLCLDYANTLTWRGREIPTDTLHSLIDLLEWVERCAGMDATATGQLGNWARQHKASAAKVFSEAIALREVVFRIFRAIAADEPIDETDFARLARAITNASARRELVRSVDGYAWSVKRLRPTVPDILTPVLWSAADLLLSTGDRRVRHCANQECLWLFIDESKNGTRRWCDMGACGNRAKARRHYARVRRVEGDTSRPPAA